MFVFKSTITSIAIKAGTKELIIIPRAGNKEEEKKKGRGKSNAKARNNLESPALQSPAIHKRKPNKNAKNPFRINAKKSNPFKKFRATAITIAEKTTLFSIMPFFKSVKEVRKPSRQIEKMFTKTKMLNI